MAEKYSNFSDSLDAKKKKRGRSCNLKSRVEIREKWGAKKAEEEAERGDRESETDQRQRYQKQGRRKGGR